MLDSGEKLGAFIVPTGVGASIGGFAGDASSWARKFAKKSKLIVNPNVVNAGGFSGITENMFYVEGYSLDEDVLGICKGSFRREFIFVKYEKIQYIMSKQNFVAKHFRVLKANIYMLASQLNRNHEIPYMAEEEIEVLKEHILDVR